MSRYDTSHMIAEYEDDFGNKYKNVPFKIQLGAPYLTYYASRSGGSCGGSLPFKTRRLVALFEDGRKLIYPVAKESEVKTVTQNLVAQGALCVDLIGEKWGVLTGPVVGGDLNYRITPYNGLTASKTYIVGGYDYTSELGLTGLETVRLPVRIPNDGSQELYSAQQGCLENFETSVGICSAGNLVKARHLIIQARAIDSDTTDPKSVIRKAFVSVKGDLAQCATQSAEAAFCLGYQGESINNIHRLAGSLQPAP